MGLLEEIRHEIISHYVTKELWIEAGERKSSFSLHNWNYQRMNGNKYLLTKKWTVKSNNSRYGTPKEDIVITTTAPAFPYSL